MAGLGAASRLRLDVHGTGWYPVASTSGRCGCARVGVAGDLLGCASRARAPAVQPLAARPRRHARAPPTVTAAAAPGGARDAAAPPARPSRSAPEAAATAAEASAPPAATAEAGEAAFGRAASLSRAAMSAQPLAARAAAAAAARGPSVGASARRSASGGGRAAGGGAPASFLVVLAGGALAAAAALRAKARLVRECSTCRGYGVERCALCAGRGAIEWEGKVRARLRFFFYVFGRCQFFVSRRIAPTYPVSALPPLALCR
jgi:hypothetical protein